MKSIAFSKLNGQGNDFILIDSFNENIKLSPAQIKSMCDRHCGIGADGLIIVEKSKDSDFYMDYYNQDGSKAEMCGNGIRCMSRFIYDKGLIKNTKFNIDTLAGVKSIEIQLSNDSIESVKVDMGPPIFNAQDIPVNQLNREIFNYRLSTSVGDYLINCVSMGNPHCIIYLKKDNDLEKIPLDIWGPELENHPFFPNKTNVEFVKIINENEIEMRVWERGVGETLACGTGACAAAVSSFKLKKINGTTAIVNVVGGLLRITWKGQNSSVFLEGNVEHSFNGVYFLK